MVCFEITTPKPSGVAKFAVAVHWSCLWAVTTKRIGQTCNSEFLQIDTVLIAVASFRPPSLKVFICSSSEWVLKWLSTKSQFLLSEIGSDESLMIVMCQGRGVFSISLSCSGRFKVWLALALGFWKNRSHSSTPCQSSGWGGNYLRWIHGCDREDHQQQAPEMDHQSRRAEGGDSMPRWNPAKTTLCVKFGSIFGRRWRFILPFGTRPWRILVLWQGTQVYPVGYLSHVCLHSWHVVDIELAIWCWGLRLGAVELWFSAVSMFDFFLSFDFPELVGTMKALPHPKFYCQPWSFLALPAFLNIFFCKKHVFQKTRNFFRCVTHPLGWWLPMGGCEAEVV